MSEWSGVSPASGGPAGGGRDGERYTFGENLPLTPPPSSLIWQLLFFYILHLIISFRRNASKVHVQSRWGQRVGSFWNISYFHRRRQSNTVQQAAVSLATAHNGREDAKHSSEDRTSQGGGTVARASGALPADQWRLGSEKGILEHKDQAQLHQRQVSSWFLFLQTKKWNCKDSFLGFSQMQWPKDGEALPEPDAVQTVKKRPSG